MNLKSYLVENYQNSDNIWDNKAVQSHCDNSKYNVYVLYKQPETDLHEGYLKWWYMCSYVYTSFPTLTNKKIR